MNYVSIDVLRYAAAIVEKMRNAPEEANAQFICEYQAHPGSGTIDCWRQPEYLVPDSTRVSGGGDIERKPMFFCREHTAEIVGEELEEQPVFGRIVNPGE
jgi:hypothetical protein